MLEALFAGEAADTSVALHYHAVHWCMQRASCMLDTLDVCDLTVFYFTRLSAQRHPNGTLVGHEFGL